MSSSFVITPSGPTSPSYFLAVCIVIPLLDIVGVALRFNVRRLQKLQLKIEDWTTLLALLFVVGLAVCGIIGEAIGVWAHLTQADATDASTTSEGQLLEAFQYIQIFALGLIKFSAVAFYSRIFTVKSGRTVFDIVNSLTIAIVGLWMIAMLIMNSLQCGSHIAALWTGYDDWNVYCSKISPAFEEAFGITNFLLDLWIILLPLPKIFSLHASTGRKVGISGVFLLASIGFGASIARMVVYIQLSIDELSPATDYRLVDTAEVYWSILEAGLCLLAVNLPSLWYYRHKLSPESVLASIRSAISLRSLRSNQSEALALRKDHQSTHSASSQTKFASMETSEAYVMRDIEAQEDEIAAPPPGTIIVSSRIQQEETMV